MNRNGETEIVLLGNTYQAKFTWSAYEKILDKTGFCAYAKFTEINQISAAMAKEEMFSSSEGIFIACNELAQVISMQFAYELFFNCIREMDKTVTSEEIQDALLKEGTSPSIVTLTNESGEEYQVECDGYCFTVAKFAMWALDIGSDVKKPKSPSFLHSIIRMIKKEK